VKAAIITSFDHPPQYGDFANPEPKGPEEMLVDVLASGLHHLTRGRASGMHYSSVDMLPLIAGVDGVGRGSDGKLRYFVQSPTQIGTMAEKTVINLAHSIELPIDSDPVTIAGTMNPAMASWLALRCRVQFQCGQKVLILGATGNSGSMAVQIAKHLGASQIIAAGRDENKLSKLPELGATDVVQLGDTQLGAIACDVDVVLDFVWGEIAIQIMETILKRRSNRSIPLSWIHIGSMAGGVVTLPGAFLRSANLQIIGSGLGSVSLRGILTTLPDLAQEITRGTFHIDVQAVPLRDVTQAWSKPIPNNERIVFTP